VLVSHARVPPAMEAILSSPDNRVQAFLGAGHVCAVMGYHEYPAIAEAYHVPVVVTGFEPVDLLRGVLAAVRQLEAGRAEAENAYERAVSFEGNRSAQGVIATVFRPVDRQWRGIGMIPDSGWGLRPEFAEFDAEQRFDLADITAQESWLCIAGEILRGLKKPPECPAYASRCTPQSPLGAPMVSAEGACAAYYRYHRELVPDG
jgi:hydrogenase expression/formation protein HypD